MGSEDRASEERTPIPRISISEMTRAVRDYLGFATPFDHFWTDDWSPEFYRAQARLGFIAVAAEGPDDLGNVLIPELQRAYAVLDWADLTIDRGVRKIVESGRLERENVSLAIESDPRPVLDRLDRNWGEKSWLVPEYKWLMKALATPGERARDESFLVLGTTLFADEEPVAGELGYAVGRAYVSLSGFFRRERPEWNNFGKLQMVLLAERLRSAGFAFWNLGHPQMEYKIRLGARVVPRERFLTRWDAAMDDATPGLCRDGREVVSAGEILKA